MKKITLLSACLPLALQAMTLPTRIKLMPRITMPKCKIIVPATGRNISHTACIRAQNSPSIKNTDAVGKYQPVFKKFMTQNYTTADKTPETYQYDRNAKPAEKQNYTYENFNLFFVFEEKKDENTSIYTYVGTTNENDVEEIVEKAQKKSFSVEEKDIASSFSKLSLSLQLALKNQLAHSIYTASNGQLNLSHVVDIDALLKKAPSTLSKFYSSVIFDLAHNKGPFTGYSISCKTMFKTPWHADNIITAYILYMTAKKNMFQHTIVTALENSTQIPQNMSSKVSNLLIDFFRKPNVTNTAVALAKEKMKESTPVMVKAPHEILGVSATATHEEIKKAYFKLRLEAEAKNQADQSAALKQAYDKLIAYK